MSGVPGSGKSAVARELGLKLPAVVLDHDDTKTAILESGVSEREAGAASYSVLRALSVRFLEQGNSVIIDSPCLYSELLNHGVEVAKHYQAEYRYIECQLNDMDELDRRLRARDTRPSQIQFLDQEFRHAGAEPRLARELIEEWSVRMKRPARDWLRLDTSGPLNECVSKALDYVHRREN
jgi:predicted kinase